jgi:hypothetical protein
VSGPGKPIALGLLVGKVILFLLTPQLVPQFALSQTYSTVVADAVVVVIVVAVPVQAVTVEHVVEVLVDTV